MYDTHHAPPTGDIRVIFSYRTAQASGVVVPHGPTLSLRHGLVAVADAK